MLSQQFLAEKVSAAEEAARVKAEQEAAAAAHAAEVAELQRRRTMATNNAGKNSQSTGPISPSGSYIRRVAECSECASQQSVPHWTRRAKFRQIARRKTKRKKPKKKAARRSGEAEKRRQEEADAGAPGGHVGDPEAHRRRAGSAARRGAGVGGRLCRGVADG